jgi:hypothetical protein
MWMWGFQSRCNSVWFVRIPTFGRNLSSPSPEWKIELIRKPTNWAQQTHLYGSSVSETDVFVNVRSNYYWGYMADNSEDSASGVLSSAFCLIVHVSCCAYFFTVKTEAIYYSNCAESQRRIHYLAKRLYRETLFPCIGSCHYGRTGFDDMMIGEWRNRKLWLSNFRHWLA